jgi:hypothetical protein
MADSPALATILERVLDDLDDDTHTRMDKEVLGKIPRESWIRDTTTTLKQSLCSEGILC